TTSDAAWSRRPATSGSGAIRPAIPSSSISSRAGSFRAAGRPSSSIASSSSPRPTVNPATTLRRRPRPIPKTGSTGPRTRGRPLYRLVLGRHPAEDAIALARRLLDEPALPPGVWNPGPSHYGYGEVDEKTVKVSSFTPFPPFSGSSWEGGPALRDPVAGWS